MNREPANQPPPSTRIGHAVGLQCLLLAALCALAPGHGSAAITNGWRALPAPEGVQAMLDMDSISIDAGVRSLLIRREFTTLRAAPGAKGAPFRSTRVHYDFECAQRRASATLSAYYGDDRRLIASERHESVPRSAYALPAAGSDLAEAVRLACERLATPGTPAAPSLDMPPDAFVTRGDTSGSGIVISEAGHVLTNQHVVQQCSTVEVSDGDNVAHRAQVIHADTVRDLALLKIERRFAQPARLRAESAPQLGEAVVVTGYPLVSVLGTRPTVGFGHVSSTTGINDNTAQMQISVPIQRGNSGGPVFDQSGSVIGVVASKLDALKIAESVGDLPQNVNFAIRGEIVRAFLDAQAVPYSTVRDAPRLENTSIAARGVAVTMRVRCVRGL